MGLYQTSELTRIRKILEQGYPELKSALLAITPGVPKDSVLLDSYTGKLPVLIYAQNLATGEYENVSHGTGYEVVASVPLNRALLQSTNTHNDPGISALSPYFRVANRLTTDPGICVKWDAGQYNFVYLFYTD